MERKHKDNILHYMRSHKDTRLSFAKLSINDIAVVYFNTVVENDELIAITLYYNDQSFFGYNDEHPMSVDKLGGVQDNATQSCCFESIADLWQDIENFLALTKKNITLFVGFNELFNVSGISVIFDQLGIKPAHRLIKH